MRLCPENVLKIKKGDFQAGYYGVGSYCCSCVSATQAMGIRKPKSQLSVAPPCLLGVGQREGHTGRKASAGSLREAALLRASDSVSQGFQEQDKGKRMGGLG